MPLVSAVVGAVIALLGQAMAGRGEHRRAARQQLLEQCAQVVALEEDFHNRLWEERRLGQTGRVDGWDVAAFRLAAARVRLLTTDRRVAEALAACTRAGTNLGGYWRSGERDEDETERLWRAHKEAVEAFIVAAGGKFAGVRLRKAAG